MSGIVRRLEWDRQPPAPVRLRQEFGAEDGFAWTPFSVAESRRGESTAVRGATIVRPLVGSEVAAYATSATDAQRVSGRAGFRYGRTLFVFRFIHQGGSASFNFGYGRNDAAPSLYVEQLDANMDENGSTSVGKFRFVLRNIAGTSIVCGPSSAILTAGVLNTVVLAATSSSTIVGWVNGSPITFSYSSTGASDGEVGLPNKEFGILNFNYGSGDSWAGFSGADTNIGASLVARLIVPAAAVGRELSVSPWQIFEPEQIYVPMAGSGSPVTINCATGTALGAGLAANVASATTVAGSVGAALADGLDANIASAITVSGSVGAAVGAGLASNVASAITVAASVGAATAAGLSASVSAGDTISASVGAAVATGLAAGVASSITVAAAVGAATASGLSAGISTGNEVAAGTGAAVAAGLTAVVSSPVTVAANVGAASAAGLAGDVQTGSTIPAGIGAAVALGLTAGVSSTYIVVAAVGAAVAVGRSATLSTSGGVTMGGVRGGFAVQRQLATRRAQIQTARRRN